MSVLLAPKPAQLSFQSAQQCGHRRHPSAPVVVQPTRTPGIFSVKPQKQTPVRQLPSFQRQNAKSVAKPAKANQVVRASALTQTLEISDNKHAAAPMPTTPTPASRGRSHAKMPKDRAQTQRSESHHSAIRGKHGRQPSPPVTTQVQSQINQPPSQAEVSVISANIFDPFLDNSMISPPPSPTLARPSGKLARRRQQQSAESLVSPSPVHSKAIPVPGVKRLQYPSLSRSDPVPSHMQHSRPVPIRSSTYHEFPVCDDLTEMADEYPPSPPATPSRSSHGGARTDQPSARAPFSFPFAKMESPSPPRSTDGRGAKRNHRRVPSEGVFNMSSDEDVSSGPGGFILNKTLFSPMPRTKTTPSVFATPNARALAPRSREASPFFAPLTKEQQLEREAIEKAGYFASSMFQNSPSPEELPDPLLL